MVNPTYKHLESKLRLGLFSLGQWTQVLAALVSAILFGVYVSPLPAAPTIFLSVLVAGLPLALSYGAMGLEFSVVQFAKAAWRFWRTPRRYLPGPGETFMGYLVEADAVPIASAHDGALNEREPEALWDC